MEVVPPKPGISPVRWHPSRFCLSHSLPLHGDGAARKVVRLNLHTCITSRLSRHQTRCAHAMVGPGLETRLPACSRSPVKYLSHTLVSHSLVIMVLPSGSCGPTGPFLVQRCLALLLLQLTFACGREQRIDDLLRPAVAIDFRLGSGAVAAASKSPSILENFGKTLLPAPGKYISSIMKTKTDPSGGSFAKGRWSHRTLVPATFFIGMLCISSYICFMMPNMGSGSGNFNYRIQPPWSPENDHQHSFRAFMTDISL